MTKSPYIVVRNMLLSEKISKGMENARSYCFKVDPRANKLEIKNAVEVLFKVKVERVNTMNRRGKRKRERTAHYGRTPSHKRAMVTLKEGEKIEVV